MSGDPLDKIIDRCREQPSSLAPGLTEEELLRAYGVLPGQQLVAGPSFPEGAPITPQVTDMLKKVAAQFHANSCDKSPTGCQRHWKERWAHHFRGSPSRGPHDRGFPCPLIFGSKECRRDGAG
jgi:glycine/D-amino acid oxidase-like deaminating enzyme